MSYIKSFDTVEKIIHEELKKANYKYYYSSKVWQKIFERVFEEKPKGNTDNRWDILLHKSGYGGLTVASKFLKK